MCRKHMKHSGNANYTSSSVDYCCNLATEGPIEYKCSYSKCFSPLCCYWTSRGTCKECKDAVIVRGQGAMCGVSFMPNTKQMKVTHDGDADGTYGVEMNRGEDALPTITTYPPPTINIFYGSRAEGYDDKQGATTYHGDVCSLLGLMANMFKGACTCKSCCCTGVSPSKALVSYKQ